MTIFLVLSYYRGKRELNSTKNFVFALFLTSVLAVVSQHYLLDTVYLIDRTALFFYVLLVLLLCFSVNELSNKVYSKLLLFVVFFFGVNFFSQFNTYKTTTWYFDAHSKHMLQLINKRGKQAGRVQRIDFSWPFVMSIKYYWNEKDYPYVQIVKNERMRDEINPDMDYYIFLNRSMKFYSYFPEKQGIHPFEKDTVAEFPDEHILLFKIKELDK